MLTYHAVQALGVKPVVGRWFTQAEDHGDAEKVMLISYDLWQRRFNGTPDILGKRLRVADFGGNDTPSTIIGVMPPGFSFANAAIRLLRSAASHGSRPPQPGAEP